MSRGLGDVYKRQLWVLREVLKNALKLLHPFMPFVTEEIYSKLIPEEESLMMSKWPEYREDWDFPQAENIVEHLKRLATGVRNVRAEMNVPAGRKIKIYVVSEDQKLREGFELLKDAVLRLANASEFIVQKDKDGIAEDAMSCLLYTSPSPRDTR